MAITFKASIVRLCIVLLMGVCFAVLHTKGTFSMSHQAERKQSTVRAATPHAWALATSAILFERNNMRHDCLGGCSPTQETVANWKQVLSQWWGINSKEDLLNSLNWIENGGHRENFEKLGAYVASLDEQQLSELSTKVQNDEEARNQLDIVKRYYGKLGAKSILGWDYCRYIALCRWGYLIGYLTEQEAWDRIMPVAAMLQRNFTSWKDLGENFLVGRQFWSYEQTQSEGQRYRNIYKKLLTTSSSPWKVNPWGMKLGISDNIQSRN